MVLYILQRVLQFLFEILIIGSEEIARNALNVILKYNNSRILLNKKVVKILHNEKENKVYGVELDNG